MLARVRALAKRILPHSLFHGFVKEAWDKIKLWQDRKSFRATYPSVPYIFLNKEEISDLKKRGYYGQIGQDYFLDILFSNKSKGLFLDVGSNNPDINSNSYYFEKKGWSGYAFDPLKSLANRWISRANTRFINAAISDTIETRDFVEIIPKIGWEHQLSSFEEFVRPEDVRVYKTLKYPVRCGPVSHFIGDGKEFDFVSIDVEGAEALIIRGLELSKSPPKVILLENVSRIGGNDDHRKPLFEAGYRLLARLNMSDDIFAHETFNVPKAFDEALSRHC